MSRDFGSRGSPVEDVATVVKNTIRRSSHAEWTKAVLPAVRRPQRWRAANTGTQT